jgi:fucose 4-O-acetylase-like acetyltransferase
MKRDTSLDVAKGIGIILVVWGHTFYCPVIDEILLFHMPLFFLLSGCLFQKKDNLALYEYKRFRTLFVPFIIFYTGSWLLKVILYTLHGEKNPITDIHFYSLNTINTINYPLWFLVCLFVAVSLYSIFYKLCSKSYLLFFIILLLTIVGYMLAARQIHIPFYLTQTLIVLPFIHIGHIYYQNKENIKFSVKLVFILIAFLLFFTGILLRVKTNIFELRVDSNPILFYFPAFGGSFLTLFVSEWIAKYKWSNFLRQLGIYSLFIFAIHANTGYLDGLISGVIAKLHLLPNNQNLLWGITKTLTAISICYVIGILLKKYFPYLWSYEKNDLVIKKLSN